MGDTAAEAILIPVLAILMTFGTIILVVKYVTDYKSAARRLEHEGGAAYKRLAEEAVESQRVLVEEMKGLNATLREIERVLKEV